MKTTSTEFLRACIRGDGRGALTALHQSSWSWEACFEVASAEALLPALSGLLRELNLDVDGKEPVTGFLAAVESSNRQRNQAITCELKTAVALLNQAGIEPVLLKGLAYLACGIYRNPGARYVMDIDLLIPEEQVDIASSILRRNGFVGDDQDPFRDFRHHLPPLRRPSSVWIELHHGLGMGACGQLLPAREVIARSLPCDLDGLAARIPCPEHLLVHLIMHSQMQGAYSERIWPSFRAMYDLVLMNRRFGPELDWNAVVRRFRTSRRYSLLALHLLQLRTSTGMELPFDIRTTLVTRLRWRRRRLLHRWPALRYLDPLYMFFTLFGRRLAMLRKLLGTREGVRHLLSQIPAPGNYARIWTDLIEGRGR